MEHFTLEHVQAVCKSNFEDVSKRYAKSPTAANWRILMWVALVHQQAHQLGRASNAEKLPALLKELCHSPMGAWDDLIVHCTTGQKVEKVLQEMSW
jgi:hypothetical protein